MPRALLAVAAVLCAAVALGVAPPTPSTSMSNTPWPSAAVRVAALGRTSAAADLAWIKTVQVMGSAALAAQGYPQLEGWIDVVTSLDPTFESPYFLGAILLVTDADRAGAVDALLARGEKALPNAYGLPLARGFIAYFGKLDPGAAAEHYERASQLPGAPKWMAQFAEHLRSTSVDCKAMQTDLRALAEAGTHDQAKAMAGERFHILQKCVAAYINRVDSHYKLSHPGGLTVEQYVKAGELDEELVHKSLPPGQCWTLNFGLARAVACSTLTEETK